MSSFRAVAALAAALFLGLPAAGSSQLVPGAPATDWDMAQNDYRLTVLREYSALIGAWHSAVNAHETAAAGASYTQSAELLVSGLQPARGRDSIAAALGRLEGLVEIRTGLTNFLASDKLAFATGPMICTFRDGASARVHSFTGNHVTVLVREGRRWLIQSQVLKYEASDATSP